MARDLERNFERFRTKGDLKALAKVFDRTGRDLMSLAQHLVHHVNDAEDLVQTTFVTAIDRAQTYDSKQPLRPWLTGILSRHAANLIRRRQTRNASSEAMPDDILSGLSDSNDPIQSASEAEMHGALLNALQRMPATYRRVLEPYLLNHQRPVDIAGTLGEAPGTVRTQLHRGLERLRKILPAGVLIGSISATRGWGSVRASVLRHAEYTTVSAAAGAAVATPLLMGGVIMSQKAIIATSLVLAGAVGWAVYPPVTEDTHYGMAADSALALEQGEEPLESANLMAAPTDISIPGANRVRSNEGSLTEGTAIGSSAETKQRQNLAHGKVWLEGRILGIPEDRLEEVTLRLSKVAILDPKFDEKRFSRYSSLMKNFEELQASSESLELDIPSDYHYQATVSLADKTTTTLTSDDPWRVLIESSVSSNERVPGEVLESVEIAKNGSFRTDISQFLSDGKYAYRLHATHENYLTNAVELPIPDAMHERLVDGESHTAKVELALDPAAVLRGTAKLGKEIEVAKALDFTGGFDSSVGISGKVIEYDMAIMDMERELQAIQTIVVNRIGAQPNIDIDPDVRHGFVSARLFSIHQGAQVALFRWGETEPVDTQELGSDGVFELRHHEDGNYALVILESGFPIRLIGVDLVLGEIVELPEPLEVLPNPILRGQAQDFGLYPNGGMGIKAKRVIKKGEKSFRWNRESLVWNGMDLCRASVSASTEEDGQFAFKGLESGTYELEFDLGDANPLFSVDDLKGSACRASTPSHGLSLSLPAAILEAHLKDSPSNKDERNPTVTTLVIQDGNTKPEEGKNIAEVRMVAGETKRFLLRPNQAIRVMLKQDGEGLQELWSGISGPIGTREPVEFRLP